jgi:hypothetical protein
MARIYPGIKTRLIWKAERKERTPTPSFTRLCHRMLRRYSSSARVVPTSTRKSIAIKPLASGHDANLQPVANEPAPIVAPRMLPTNDNWQLHAGMQSSRLYVE